MMNSQFIENIRNAVESEKHRFRVHAIERCIERDIAPAEIREIILSGEIIEYYPEDKYGPSCLFFGHTSSKRVLHVNCSIDPVWIITAYDPALSPDEWEDGFRKRRVK